MSGVRPAERSLPREVIAPHTRILKCALEIEDARAYWQHADGTRTPTAAEAFDGFWFGARSMPRVEVLLLNFRARFDAFPPSLSVLHGWPHMAPETRNLICHLHLQLADPVYRKLTGELFPERIEAGLPTITREAIVRWLAQFSDAWTMATKIQFASKLLSSALSAGLVGSRRDPRPLLIPRVPTDALEYLLHLLRHVQFEGRLADNPYLRSLGITPDDLADRLRSIPSIELRRAGELHDFWFAHDDLPSWAQAHHGRAA